MIGLLGDGLLGDWNGLIGGSVDQWPVDQGPVGSVVRVSRWPKAAGDGHRPLQTGSRLSDPNAQPLSPARMFRDDKYSTDGQEEHN